MFEKEAEEILNKHCDCELLSECLEGIRTRCSDFEEQKKLLLEGIKFGYNKANEWHYVKENYKDLPNEGEWVEGLYIWYYKDEPHWDVFKVRWYYEIGELDEKLVRWYSSDETNWNKADEPDYWRKITLPTRNEHDRKY